MADFTKEIFLLQDKKYKNFQSKLIPGVDEKNVIGVKTPEIKNLAKRLLKESEEKEIESFLTSLPHKYFDEDQLHVFIISQEKDFDKCISKVNDFLPYINNWATCDQLNPGTFKKNHKKLMPYILNWLKSKETFTVRFAIKTLMQFFLDKDFDIKYALLVSQISSEEYYVNMMRAWYFATALAKQYEKVLPIIQGKKLDSWTHNKCIQKSIESLRISQEHKEYLRKLKIKQ